MAATAPILFSAVRAAARGWMPVGDPAYSSARAWDVFSTDPPLLGTWSSLSNFSGHMVNHPGPLQLDLLALPIRVLGMSWGTAVGMALINMTCVVLIGWLVGRQFGHHGATAALGLCAALSWSLGSEILFDAWQHEPLFPFALFVVAVWCVVAGDEWALVVAVAAGSYVAQTHLSYALLVPGFFVFAAAGFAWRRWRDAPDRPVPWRHVGAALLVGLVCWTQPLVEQVFVSPGEGNLAALARSAGGADDDARLPTTGQTVAVLGGTLVLPPAWLPPSYGHPSYGLDGQGRPPWLAGVGLVALAAGLALLGRRAAKRGAYAVAAGTATGLFALAIGFVTTVRTPLRWGLAPPYFRWMWPLGMVLWMVIAVALLEELRARTTASGSAESRMRHSALPERSSRLALPGVVLALVAGVAVLPTVDNGSGSPPWAVDMVDDVEDEVLAALDGRGPVLVDIYLTDPVTRSAPGLYCILQENEIPFYVSYEGWVRQFGEHRRYEPGRADVRLYARGGPHEEPEPGERLIATSSPLSGDERDELGRLTDQVEDLVGRHGLPIVDEAETLYDVSGRGEFVDGLDEQAEDPAEAIRSGTVLELTRSSMTDVARNQLLDPELFPPELIDRWSELEFRYEHHTLKIFLSDLD